MPWCPSCKLEYVKGIKICPDCNTALVDKLEEEKDGIDLVEDYRGEANADDYGRDSEDITETSDNEESEEYDEAAIKAVNDITALLRSRGLTEEDIKAIIENTRRRAQHSVPKYESIKDKSEENKSSSVVLIGCGLVGMVAIVLSLLNVIKLPFSGYSKWLVIGVMGLLFLVFLFSGIRSYLTYKRLIPEVKKEEKLIKEAVSILKGLVNEGTFDIGDKELSMEEKSLYLTDMAVMQLERDMEDENLAPGFSYYVVDSYYSEIFGSEDED